MAKAKNRTGTSYVRPPNAVGPRYADPTIAALEQLGRRIAPEVELDALSRDIKQLEREIDALKRQIGPNLVEQLEREIDALMRQIDPHETGQLERVINALKRQIGSNKTSTKARNVPARHQSNTGRRYVDPRTLTRAQLEQRMANGDDYAAAMLVLKLHYGLGNAISFDIPEKIAILDRFPESPICLALKGVTVFLEDFNKYDEVRRQFEELNLNEKLSKAAKDYHLARLILAILQKSRLVGTGVNSDGAEPLLRETAEAGDALAQFYLSDLLIKTVKAIQRHAAASDILGPQKGVAYDPDRLSYVIGTRTKESVDNLRASAAGGLCFAQEKLAEAILAEDPNFGTLTEAERRQQALHLLNQAWEKGLATAGFTRARVFEGMEDLEAAIATYRALLDAPETLLGEGDHRRVKGNLARVLALSGKNDEALGLGLHSIIIDLVTPLKEMAARHIAGAAFHDDWEAAILAFRAFYNHSEDDLTLLIRRGEGIALEDIQARLFAETPEDALPRAWIPNPDPEPDGRLIPLTWDLFKSGVSLDGLVIAPEDRQEARAWYDAEGRGEKRSPPAAAIAMRLHGGAGDDEAAFGVLAEVLAAAGVGDLDSYGEQIVEAIQPSLRRRLWDATDAGYFRIDEGAVIAGMQLRLMPDDPEEALPWLREAATHGLTADLVLAQADAEFKAGNFRTAISQYEKATDLGAEDVGPQIGNCQVGLAQNYEKEGQFLNALSQYRRAHQTGHPDARERSISLCLAQAREAGWERLPHRALEWSMRAVTEFGSQRATLLILENWAVGTTGLPPEWMKQLSATTDTELANALFLGLTEKHDELFIADLPRMDPIRSAITASTWQKGEDGAFYPCPPDIDLANASDLVFLPKDPMLAFTALEEMAKGAMSIDHALTLARLYDRSARPDAALSHYAIAAEQGFVPAQLELIVRCHNTDMPYPEDVADRVGATDKDAITYALAYELTQMRSLLSEEEQTRLNEIWRPLTPRAWQQDENGTIRPLREGVDVEASSLVIMPQDEAEVIATLKARANEATTISLDHALALAAHSNVLEALENFGKVTERELPLARQESIGLYRQTAGEFIGDPNTALTLYREAAALDGRPVPVLVEIETFMALARNRTNTPKTTLDLLGQAADLGSPEALLQIVRRCANNNLEFPRSLAARFDTTDTNSIAYQLATELDKSRSLLSAGDQIRLDSLRQSLLARAWQVNEDGTVRCLREGSDAHASSLIFMPANSAAAIAALKIRANEAAAISLDHALALAPHSDVSQAVYYYGKVGGHELSAARQEAIDLCRRAAADLVDDPYAALELYREAAALDGRPVPVLVEIETYLAVARDPFNTADATLERLRQAAELGSREALLQITRRSYDDNEKFPENLVAGHEATDINAIAFQLVAELNQSRDLFSEGDQNALDTLTQSLSARAWQMNEDGSLSRVSAGSDVPASSVIFVSNDDALALDFIRQNAQEWPLSLDMALALGWHDPADAERPPEHNEVVEWYRASRQMDAPATVFHIIRDWHENGTPLPRGWAEDRDIDIEENVVYPLLSQLSREKDKLPEGDRAVLDDIRRRLLADAWVLGADQLVRPLGEEQKKDGADPEIAADEELRFFPRNGDGLAAILEFDGASLEVNVRIAESIALGEGTPDINRTVALDRLSKVLIDPRTIPFPDDYAETGERIGVLANTHPKRAELQKLWDAIAYNMWVKSNLGQNLLTLDPQTNKWMALAPDDDGQSHPYTCDMRYKKNLTSLIELGHRRYSRTQLAA